MAFAGTKKVFRSEKHPFASKFLSFAQGSARKADFRNFQHAKGISSQNSNCERKSFAFCQLRRETFRSMIVLFVLTWLAKGKISQVKRCESPRFRKTSFAKPGISQWIICEGKYFAGMILRKAVSRKLLFANLGHSQLDICEGISFAVLNDAKG